MEKFTETERHFIGLLQDTINRMANNSANCKNWFIAIVSAMMAIVANNIEAVDLLWLLVFVDFLFYLLDSYYLQLENNFRNLERNFVKKTLEKNNDVELDKLLYDFDFMKLEDGNVNRRNKYKALKSKATLPFYLSILFLIIVMYFVISDINPFTCIVDWFCSLCCKCK